MFACVLVVYLSTPSNPWPGGITALLTLGTISLFSLIFTTQIETTSWPMSVCRLCHRIWTLRLWYNPHIFQAELRQMIIDANGKEKHISAHVSQHFRAIQLLTREHLWQCQKLVKKFEERGNMNKVLINFWIFNTFSQYNRASQSP